jgi:hypothetical protein
MGRKKAKRAMKHLKMFNQFASNSGFYVYSEISGRFLGFEFDGRDRESMEKHWDLEVSRCSAGDFVELYRDGDFVRRFDGKGFSTSTVHYNHGNCPHV